MQQDSILRLAGDKRLDPVMHGPLITSRYLIFLVAINFKCNKAPGSMHRIDTKTGWYPGPKESLRVRYVGGGRHGG
jgi:hypothetical protein